MVMLANSTLAVAAAQSTPISNVACSRHYTIVEGDTCDKIGAKTLTSTYQVMALNLPEAGPDCFTLTPGHQICLGRYGSDCQIVYRATSSDTCSSIASAFGISLSLLKSNNPTLDCGIVYDGLMLCTAPGNIVPVTPSGLNSSYLLLGRRGYDVAQVQKAAQALEVGDGAIVRDASHAHGSSARHAHRSAHHAHMRKNAH
ncbi:carbohydrate-binding module family 50 protein [Tilletiaria anomala UBC 951]|uniref:Carbohydrate-binding module family 50 protein n=1 Tax=Tilletiaria anomala (strain ATCC 24038 / CBS 436.72 / UBC 951) TaxID=1037660 RepID=A0A066VUV4_TILAU|nr:carbohydrate-binding module family 50 protein [Tilletiaria anomala UBC 951]KDN45261.1 carbohydrate-binding module family 50 protein [Tilletiaria anomala UBC 951]